MWIKITRIFLSNHSIKYNNKTYIILSTKTHHEKYNLGNVSKYSRSKKLFRFRIPPGTFLINRFTRILTNTGTLWRIVAIFHYTIVKLVERWARGAWKWRDISPLIIVERANRGYVHTRVFTAYHVFTRILAFDTETHRFDVAVIDQRLPIRFTVCYILRSRLLLVRWDDKLLARISKRRVRRERKNWNSMKIDRSK